MAIIILRTMIIYFALLITMRLLGKRQLGEMELSEFVVASLIADLASHPLQDVGIPMINGLIPIFTLFCCEVIISGLTLKSIRLRTLLFGKPSMLIIRGQICQREMKANRFTLDELMQELRTQGITDISKVEYAILETDGQLNVIPFPASQPATAAQLGVTVEDGGYPGIVINDGRVLEGNLKQLGLDKGWLREELEKGGHGEPEGIYLMTVNHHGQTYVARKEMG
ncbi:MAG: DUF421 domain-containing protein [Oscillospiraceae bacterium]|nr:DUF421 domain-containing protein [Oscillospiraceae bacterium]